MSLAQSFARSGFGRFMNSMAGRSTRMIVGLALIIYGYTQLGQSSGIIWMIIGVVFLAAGALDFCLISPLVGGPLFGKKIRASAKEP
jgi:uncharacterized RDD family membrane protein YckC